MSHVKHLSLWFPLSLLRAKGGESELVFATVDEWSLVYQGEQEIINFVVSKWLVRMDFATQAHYSIYPPVT